MINKVQQVLRWQQDVGWLFIWRCKLRFSKTLQPFKFWPEMEMLTNNRT